MISIKSIKGKIGMNKFINFPNVLYKNNTYYVPPLFIQQKDLFNQRKNPFLSHSTIKCIMAFKNKKPCGRLAAITYNYKDHYVKQKTTYFGFYDVINDLAVSNELFNHLVENHIDQDCKTSIGPVNPTTNDTCALLIDGFESAPVVGMPYNNDYYEKFLFEYGFKSRDILYAYSMAGDQVKDRLGKLSSDISRRLGSMNIHFRNVNYKSPLADLKQLYELYHSSNVSNPIFMPMCWEEFHKMAMDIKSITSVNHIVVATHGENIVGYIVAIPNINEILIKIKNGKLFPFGFLHLIGRKRFHSARILILGVLEKYRNLGIDVYLYNRITENLADSGIVAGEAAYVHEKNNNLVPILKKLGGFPIKKYGLYELILR